MKLTSVLIIVSNHILNSFGVRPFLLSQEEIRHAMWDTTGMTNFTTLRLPRLAVVPYELVERLSKKGRTPNELRIWLEK